MCSTSSLTEKVLDSKPAFSGIIINVRHDKVELPNGQSAQREVVEHPGAVAVVPITADHKILLVRQYRHAVGKILLEIPAGKLDKGEHPNICAQRELREETGFTAGHMQKLASIYTAPGFTDEIIHLYEAKGLTFSGQSTDEDEFIQVEAFTPEQIKQMLQDGTICDAKTAVALSLAGVTETRK